jgi:hypothetical protein
MKSRATSLALLVLLIGLSLWATGKLAGIFEAVFGEAPSEAPKSRAKK